MIVRFLLVPDGPPTPLPESKVVLALVVSKRVVADRVGLAVVALVEPPPVKLRC